MAQPKNKRHEGIEWVIKSVRPRASWRDPKIRQGYIRPFKFNVRKCDICDTVWDYDVSTDYINMIFYADFPKYGLDFLTCLKCDPTKSYEITNSKKKVRVIYDSDFSNARIRKTKR